MSLLTDWQAWEALACRNLITPPIDERLRGVNPLIQSRPVIYLIGSLRNPNIPVLGTSLREAGFEVFDDWFAAGPEADDYWQKYEQGRGRSYGEALKGLAARNVFEFDRKHLDRANVTVLVMPAGKSGHLEFGRSIGRGLPSYVVFPDREPERWDVMYQFATDVFFNDAALIERLRRDHL